MFAVTPVCTIDEVEIDRTPTAGDDDQTYNHNDDDDATEGSQRSFTPYNVMPIQSLSPTGSGGGTILMEGWLNHTTSSHKDGSCCQTPNASGSGGTTPPPTSSSSSILSKTVSKQQKRQTNKKQPRYFVLRGNTLSYYSRQHDVKAKGTLVLTTGCAVGPVMYGSLEDPPSSMEVAPSADDHQQSEAGFPGSQSSSREGNYSALASSQPSVAPSVATGHVSNKSKKKKRKFYCVQVTWPINDKPSKDVKFMAQAKAQVAAESEKEAMQQQQQQSHLQELEPSFEDIATSTTPTKNNIRNKSPLPPRPRGPRRRSDAAKSPRKSTMVVDFPPDIIYPPSLDDDDPYDNENEQDHANDVGHEQQQVRAVSLLPTPRTASAMNTPASTMPGMNAFHHPGIRNRNPPSTENNNPTSLNHETGVHKHYTQQIEKKAKDQQQMAEELQKVMLLLSRKKSHKKTKRKIMQGTKVAAVSTAAITAGVLTAGIGLAAGLVFVGITAAAGGSGAVVGSKVLDKARGKYNRHQSRKSFHLVIAAGSYEEALRWRKAMEGVVRELVEEQVEVEEWRTKSGHSGSCGGEESAEPLSPNHNSLLSPNHNNLLGASSSDSVITGSGATFGGVAPSSPQKSMANSFKGGGTPKNQNGNSNDISNESNMNENNDAYQHVDPTPKWVPIQGGGMALWGILGAFGGGGGNLRIYREELSSPSHPYSTSSYSSAPLPAFPAIPRFRSDVGLVGQPFPPFKASITLKANSLDAFMCLMTSGRIHNEKITGVRPNSGQISSFRIIETMDDHMDVVHLVLRPLYLFPSWTAPRDFVLYRFWKYDDDGTYQVCLDSGQHRDCLRVEGYVRGEMHSVYTIAPLRKRRKKRTSSTGAPPTSTRAVGAAATSEHQCNLADEECLLSHVVQVDPNGWVPTTSSLPFLRNQGYGDAFAVMALHQMLDVKEALDSVRFVAVPMDNVTHHNNHSNSFFAGQGGKRAKMPRRLLLGSGGKAAGGGGRPLRGLVQGRSGGGGGQQQQQILVPTLETSGSGYVSEEEEPDTADYDFKYSNEYHQSPPEQMQRSSSSTSAKNTCVPISCVNGELQRHNNGSDKENTNSMASPSIGSTPPPMINKWWAEPDANSYRVRGKTYKTDSKKVNAGPSLFRLLAAEIVETDVPIMTGMCLHPKERVQLALQREAEAHSKGMTSSDMPPFVFAVNIALPGPPNYHMVSYYAVDDLSTIDGSDGTPSSKLCQEFFFGNKDDTFRDSTFKLIPQIIEGNFMVRKAVGSTPAIMGNKIKQTYVRGERFFELIIDTGSSAVAAGVIRICNGYAKMIVVDLAFLFEGYNERTLPERVLGCVRLKNAEFGKKLRFVESVDD